MRRFPGPDRQLLDAILTASIYAIVVSISLSAAVQLGLVLAGR